jgi:transketolase C-terminal domain/subunit
MSVGIGIGYADAGPTHYITEDFACLRSIINCNIYTTADAGTARRLAKKLLDKPELSYIRFDRHDQPELEVTNFVTDLDYRLMNDMVNEDKVVVIGSGKMAHIVKQAHNEAHGKIFGVDLIHAKPFPKTLLNVINVSKGVIVIDEQTPSGSLGAAVMEACADADIQKKIKTITIPEMYVYENGGREYLLNKLGLNKESILKTLNDNF